MTQNWDVYKDMGGSVYMHVVIMYVVGYKLDILSKKRRVVALCSRGLEINRKDWRGLGLGNVCNARWRSGSIGLKMRQGRNETMNET